VASTKVKKRYVRQKAGAADAQVQGSFVFPTELGWMAIGWTGGKLKGFTLGHPSAAAAHAALGEMSAPDSDPPPFVRGLAERIQAFAAGGKDDFRDVPLDLSHLTDFQRRVVEQCRRIHAGQTMSYGELAAKAGYPGAARAVGSTMARNRFPIVVPCHRVVAAGGAIGGFSAPSGISLKQRLLTLEGAISPRPRKSK
jgi:methylated-DNA-[protein]-cysteine S-methyltransferase